MQPDFEQSLDAHSEFIPIGRPKQDQDLGESLVAESQKIYFQNASTINRQELEKAKQYLPQEKGKNSKQLSQIKQQGDEESANQFLQVGKWKKAKDSTMSKDLQNVKKQVDKVLTQTKWKKKDQPASQQVIADQSIAPEQDGEQIEDQTQQDEGQQQESSSEEEQQEEESSEEQEEQEEQQQSEESEEEQEQQEQEEQQEEQKLQKEDENLLKSQQQTVYSKPSSKPSPHSQKVGQSMISDRTDTKSQMKKTEYLPTKWSKKGSQIPTEDPWQRKEAILLRIVKLVS